MSLPFPNVKNGDVPDVSLIMADLNYLLTLIGSGGATIAEGLFSARPESPTSAQFYYATDQKQMYFYSLATMEWTAK